jgi:hypothetical protein
MKALLYIGLLILWLAYVPGIMAQVIVTAHVTAEVVEATAIAPATHNILTLQRDNPVDNIDLGNITVSGKSSAMCNIMIKNSDLQNQAGEFISFATKNTSLQSTKILDANGQGQINLYAAADSKIFSQNQQQFVGGYNINFVYN